MKKVRKGEAGYIAWQRFSRLCRSVLLLALPLITFAAAWIMTGTRKNVISVLAMVAMIPAAMSIVSLIMVYTIRPIPAEVYEQLQKQMEAGE